MEKLVSKIKSRIRSYFARKSTPGIIGDAFFYVFFLLILIPGTRKHIVVTVNRVIMHRPVLISEEKALHIPDEAYNWPVLDLEGKLHTMDEFKDGVILLNIWATWCPPCIAEMPGLQNLYDQYGDKLVFLLVSQESKEVLTAFMKKNSYDMPVYRMIKNPPDIFKTSSIPTTFLINRQGKIVISKTGSARWDSEAFTNRLDELLSE